MHENVKLAFVFKLAKDMPSFLDQDRPEGVKDVYRALKRDHPEMSAEMKARIAARQGKPGKQKQGPPYKGPIKEAMFARKALKLERLGEALETAKKIDRQSKGLKPKNVKAEWFGDASKAVTSGT